MIKKKEKERKINRSKFIVDLDFVVIRNRL